MEVTIEEIGVLLCIEVNLGKVNWCSRCPLIIICSAHQPQSQSQSQSQFQSHPHSHPSSSHRLIVLIPAVAESTRFRPAECVRTFNVQRYRLFSLNFAPRILAVAGCTESVPNCRNLTAVPTSGGLAHPDIVFELEGAIGTGPSAHKTLVGVDPVCWQQVGPRFGFIVL